MFNNTKTKKTLAKGFFILAFMFIIVYMTAIDVSGNATALANNNMAKPVEAVLVSPPEYTEPLAEVIVSPPEYIHP